MRRFALAAVLAGVGLVVSASTADAQLVYGNRPVYAPGTVVTPYGVVTPRIASPTPVYTAGYYSPYPGTLYSPFTPAAYNYYSGPGYYSAGYSYRSGYYSVAPSRGYYRGPYAPRYRRW